MRYEMDHTGATIDIHGGGGAAMILPAKRDARPFIKWAGGKQQLLAQFGAYFPKNFKRYFEPFVGSGAVFYRLWNQRLLPEQVYLLDNNEELIHVYRTVRDRLEELVQFLRFLS